MKKIRVWKRLNLHAVGAFFIGTAMQTGRAALPWLLVGLGLHASQAWTQTSYPANGSEASQRAVIQSRFAQAEAELAINRATQRRTDLTPAQRAQLDERARALSAEIGELNAQLSRLR